MKSRKSHAPLKYMASAEELSDRKSSEISPPILMFLSYFIVFYPSLNWYRYYCFIVFILSIYPNKVLILILYC